MSIDGAPRPQAYGVVEVSWRHVVEIGMILISVRVNTLIIIFIPSPWKSRCSLSTESCRFDGFNIHWIRETKIVNFDRWRLMNIHGIHLCFVDFDGVHLIDMRTFLFIIWCISIAIFLLFFKFVTIFIIGLKIEVVWLLGNHFNDHRKTHWNRIPILSKHIFG